MTSTTAFEPLTLPNGKTLQNRIAKAAMEENMADQDHAPSAELIRLYQAWAKGGVALAITGNVMVDYRAMTGPGGMVLNNDHYAERFRAWAAAAKSGGGAVWMQLNHPGRQMPATLQQPTIAPSAVALDMGKFSNQFTPPTPMTELDITDLKARFVTSATLAEQFGFDGVQVHAAHGYLLGQFLSPLTNQRTDKWGGSLENRARLLIEIVRDIRNAVSPEFAVSVKLNSADFQRGGFSTDDAKHVVEMLNPLGIDLIELSGGSYEAPAMHGSARDGRTLAREAYFLEFAQDIAAIATVPVMVTGGIRRLPIAEQVLASGVDVVGIATALAIDPELPNRWREDASAAPALGPINLSNKVLASLAYMAMVKHQLRRVSHGKLPKPNIAPIHALLIQQLDTFRKNRRYRKWVQKQSA